MPADFTLSPLKSNTDRSFTVACGLMHYCSMWWVDPGGLLDTHPAAFSLLLLNRTRENKVRWKSS